MPITVYGNQPSGTVTAGGTTTSDTSFTVTVTNAFPAASSTAVPPTVFHFADPALPAELMTAVTAPGGAGAGQSWTVTRGAEGTPAVPHAASWTAVQVVSAGDLTAMRQGTGAAVAGATVSNTTTETVVCSYQPVTGEVAAGTAYQLTASGIMRASVTASLLTWRIRWGGVSGTVLLGMANGTTGLGGATFVGNAACSAFSSAMSVTQGIPFSITGAVTFISTTSAVASLNFTYNLSATPACGLGVASSSTAVTGLTAPPGGGPLVLTATWSSATSVVGMTVPAPLACRVA